MIVDSLSRYFVSVLSLVSICILFEKYIKLYTIIVVLALCLICRFLHWPIRFVVTVVYVGVSLIRMHIICRLRIL